MSLSPEQIEMRSTGIGASEAPAVVGLSSYRAPIDVFNVKRKIVPAFEGNERTEWGNLLEPVIAAKYAASRKVDVVKKSETLRMSKHPIILASPDYCVLSGAKIDRLLQIKNAGLYMADQWGESGSNNVPEYVYCQVQQEMAVTGLPLCDVAVLIGGSEFRVYTVEADTVYISHVIAAEEEFWNKHVVPGIPPPVDGSASWANELTRRFPRDLKPMLPATPEAEALAVSLRTAREQKQAAENAEEYAKNGLKALIGDAAGIEGVATWKATKPARKVDWQAVCEEIEPPAAIVAKHTTERPGSRRFVIKGGE